MMAKIAKWMLYIASYGLLYVILIVKSFLGMARDHSMTFAESFSLHLRDNLVFLCTLFVLLIISIIWHLYMFRLSNNTRINKEPIGNATLETVAFIVPYLADFFTIDLNAVALLSNLFVFILLGFAFVHSDKIGMSPLFLIRVYKLYSVGNQYILSRSSSDSLRVAMRDSSNGIQVREICRGTYLHLPTR